MTLTVLAVASTQLLPPSSATGTSSPSAGAGGTVTARADFNGDGYGDLAIGVPFEDVVTYDEGMVNVIYGSGIGLTAIRNQLWSQNGDIIGSPEAGDMFGASLAAADFDGDGYTDLAIGVPGEDHVSVDDGGVAVIYGSNQGLVSTGNEFWSQDRILGTAEKDDRFGYALAAADFGHGSRADLAVGVPKDGPSDAGVVNVIYGTPTGLTATGNQMLAQGDDGIKGTAEPGDHFGYSLAAANLGRSSQADLAIGVPEENALDNGGVNVVYGTANGLDDLGNQYWEQGLSGIQGTAEEDDRFGYSLAAADFGKSSYADLAVGVPYENTRDDGGVNVIYGGANGLTATGNRFWNQDSSGIEDNAETGDAFGFSLAAADFGHSAHADLAIGVPYEDYVVSDAGAVEVIYGSASGLIADGDQFWTQDSPGIPDWIEKNDAFGTTLVAANFGQDTQADLAVGIPAEDYKAISDGEVDVIYGTGHGLDADQSQLWSQYSRDILGTAEDFDEFGFVVGAAR
jgi:hypothetical protein